MFAQLKKQPEMKNTHDGTSMFVSGTLDPLLILGLWRNSLVLLVILAVKFFRDVTGLSLANGMSKWI